jgi:hypothetical protein
VYAHLLQLQQGFATAGVFLFARDVMAKLQFYKTVASVDWRKTSDRFDRTALKSFFRLGRLNTLVTATRTNN